MSASPAQPVALRDLGVDDVELLGRLHRDVLAVSFSPDELEDAQELARGLRGEGDTEMLATVALGRDGVVLGGAVAEVYADEHVLLLSYLSVRAELRGRGIGTMLMEHVAPRWYGHPAVRLAVAEVHDPRRWRSEEHDTSLSRLRLFERLGARLLAVPFVQPALGSGRERVPGFLLLSFHADPSIQSDDGRAVRADIVGRFVRRYFEAAEGIRAPYDAQLTRLLERIEAHPEIPLLPVAEYRRVPPLA
jgi:GNAT superfamily N-acetyltransferase